MTTKRELKLIAFSAVFLLFIAGCAGGDKAPTGAPTTPFLGGTGGLKISFLEGSPPEEVTDGDTFPFQAVVSLKNMGEHDVATTDAKINLIGFLPSLFQSAAPADFVDADLKDKPLPDILKGRQRDSEGNIIESVETFLSFPTDAKSFQYKGELAGNTIFVFRADVCYKYQTKAVSEICVLANQVDVADDAICKPSEAKTVFSSGSPLQVTSFKQNVVGKDKIQLSFDIAHSGAGDVFDIEPADITAAKTALDAAITTATTTPNADNVAAIATARTTLYSAITSAAFSSADITAAKTALDAAITTATTTANADNVAAIATARTTLYSAITVISNCPKTPTERRTKEDKVKIMIDTGLTAGKLKCVGLADVGGATTSKQEGIVKLVNGKRTITCTQDLDDGRTDFIKSVDITLGFNYLSSADKEILVKHLVD